MQNLLRYIEIHYHEKISLDSIAKDLGFSKFYLSRIFSNKIGYQFNDYINRLRINKAQKLLSETDLPVTVIALECGFESQRNFNRIFKELTTLTPTKFRTGI
ncbi:YesN/AraC family two-component response regulator [Clostridium beijerinckii]|nr:helix-turn-helix transcriptional regulator [Clostridium beijerinckii]NRU22139.1 YesN/AraC family two-component response regulator [Clostridium beijerinckii]